MTRNQLQKGLTPYIPEASLDYCIDLIVKYKIQMRITHSRNSKFGDYRSPHNGHGHRISINHNLNTYAFLVTFLHEVAHLITYLQHERDAEPHGIHWKQNFKHLLIPVLQSKIFPAAIAHAIEQSLHGMAASSCSDAKLFKALHAYNTTGHILLEDVEPNAHFRIKGHCIVFIKGDRIRKNFLCTRLDNNKLYRIAPIAEVEIIEQHSQ
ncbi:MAG: SprT-like domain-containing protein [Bacteroidetes bacterium]|nr:SprT-like domain-containing protein [Bacteroidota bacterium]